MPSLKEIRGRINSVSATLKITDVNRMISSAKLHKAQNALCAFLPYKEKITSIFHNLTTTLPDTKIPLLNKNNSSKKVLIVAFSSNTGLAGAFNLNVIKKTTEIVENYRNNSFTVLLYTIGKKVHDGFSQYKNITLVDKTEEILNHPSYSQVSALAENFMEMFLNNEVDEVILIHNKFKNILTQYITEKKLLPLEIVEENNKKGFTTDYILEPNEETLLKILAPQAVKLEMFESLLESMTAEYGARTTAMHAATENAQDLITDLRIQYNKVRQAAITGELIDIVGGSEALR